MTSWRTTLGGMLGAAGAALMALDAPTAKTIGVVLSALAFLIMGASARDNNVTSEQAGAK